VSDLLDDYGAPLDTWDEMFSEPSQPREAYQALYDSVLTLSNIEFEGRCRLRDDHLRDQGITFSLSGEERPLPLDLVPRVIASDEWAVIEQGVAQRVKALEAFLEDVYGVGEILAEGVVPRRLVTSSSHFHRAAHGIRPPNGVRVQVAGIDLVRDQHGDYRVLEDNLRTPSGISYVVENRRTMTHVLPELFARQRVRPVGEYPSRLLRALLASSPRHVDEPTVVVLTPGVHNSAHFEHAFLARQMGVELVEGRDLTCRDGVVWMRTTSGLHRVDVIYRRIDDDYLDPLQFRPDSLLGVAGILNSARAGNVTLANAVGNGVADDKAVYRYVPEMIRYYLGERPILPNVATYDLEDPDQQAAALDRLDRIVCKPVDGSGGYGLVIGPQADDEQLSKLDGAIRADPRAWVAQEVVRLSTAPTYDGAHLRPRHVDLRPFAVHDGEKVWVVPGGLTRVALPEGSLVVNSSQGGGSKDTWVLARPGDQPERLGGARAPIEGTPRSGEPPQTGPEDARVEQQQQQQQQQRAGTGAPVSAPAGRTRPPEARDRC
jgi:uncharacterized circularly permuted ATP-grasp superfamily protein